MRVLELTEPQRHDVFATAVVEGLSKPRKTLPCQFLYDAHGSALFEQITELPEYYPTRTEIGILREQAAEITASVPDDAVLVEFGSGSSIKTELLLQHLPPTVAYVPIDVSPSALSEARQRLAHRFPKLHVYPITGSFTDSVELPAHFHQRPRVGFFPGSTIGNWTAEDAVCLLASFRGVLNENGRLIVGVDLKKDARTLVRAYNDSAGITAAFNLNLLVRINRELGSAIDISSFRHEVIYDPLRGRIEMHLVSVIEQTVLICGRRFHLRAGESIHTENSYKYTVAEFQDLARQAGWSTGRVWTDDGAQFSIHEMTARSNA
ncbi:MAG: L-histidine N(alpha)-methyltransferase [Hyphomicrobium sp. 12-62-95]|nr:MAG: L-histidine N(alpha)-methyltransferase [Hyphomicrobium sp. 12-62-95]